MDIVISIILGLKNASWFLTLFLFLHQDGIAPGPVKSLQVFFTFLQYPYQWHTPEFLTFLVPLVQQTVRMQGIWSIAITNNT